MNFRVRNATVAMYSSWMPARLYQKLLSASSTAGFSSRCPPKTSDGNPSVKVAQSGAPLSYWRSVVSPPGIGGGLARPTYLEYASWCMSKITYMPSARAQPTTWAMRARYVWLNCPRAGSSRLHEIGSRSELNPNAAICVMSVRHRGGTLTSEELSGQRPS